MSSLTTPYRCYFNDFINPIPLITCVVVKDARRFRLYQIFRFRGNRKRKTTQISMYTCYIHIINMLYI